MTDLSTVRIVITLAAEDASDLQDILDEVQDLAGGHPSVLTITVEGEARQ